MKKIYYLILINIVLNLEANFKISDELYKELKKEISCCKTSSINKSLISNHPILNSIHDPLLFEIKDGEIVVKFKGKILKDKFININKDIIINPRIADRVVIIYNALIKAKELGHKLPNTSFICILRDFGPVIKDLAMFYIAGRDKCEPVIIIPDPGLFHENRRKLVESIVKENLNNPWKSKKPKIYWRGSLTGIFDINNPNKNIRWWASMLSLANPKIIDAKITGFPEEASSYTDLVKKRYPNIIDSPVDTVEFLKYKYILALDGWTGPSLLQYWALFSNSLIFRQDSEWRYFFENALKPYTHYIPVKKDLSDIFEKYEWAEKNQEKCLEIIKNANNFAAKNLKEEDVHNYLATVVNEYHKIYTE